LAAIGGVVWLAALAIPTAWAAPGEWTWMHGSNTTEVAGSYGTLGVAAASNAPGARIYPTGWSAGDGKLWLFGGDGLDVAGNVGYLNDLWKFEVSSGMWVWMGGSKVGNPVGVYGSKGVANAANTPGGRRSAVTWTGGDGSFWLFGGLGWGFSNFDAGRLNDLWKRDPDSGQWIWMAGSNTYNQAGVYGTKGVAHADNVPGGRDSAVAWIDSAGKLWLFGGYGRDGVGTWGYLNDLWRFDPALGLWTWVDGTSSANQFSLYGGGTIRPGGRSTAHVCPDMAGGAWLFGGIGYGASGSVGNLNDLWHRDSSGVWTWVDGATVVNQAGVYGTKGVAHPDNQPGARNAASVWVDPSGGLCLFGGAGRDAVGSSGLLNDLWRFDASGQWTWLGGSHLINANGVYGTKGVPHPDNIPGARGQGYCWNDGQGNLWIFGGWGRYHLIGASGRRNDLWRYTLPLAPPPLPPRITGLHRTGATTWEIHWTGEPGARYQLQEATSLGAGAFTDTGAPLTCGEGTNILSCEASGPRWFWRLREAP
jgi:N-acetylneuraminic acid mutarotase